MGQRALKGMQERQGCVGKKRLQKTSAPAFGVLSGVGTGNFCFSDKLSAVYQLTGSVFFSLKDSITLVPANFYKNA